MKIWLYHSGCEYEGGATNSIHKTREGALKAAYNQAKEYSDRMINFFKSSEYEVDLTEDLNNWKLIEIENGYKVASDIYIVYELELEE